jgi:hypothetical protein
VDEQNKTRQQKKKALKATANHILDTNVQGYKIDKEMVVHCTTISLSILSSFFPSSIISWGYLFN